MVHFQWKCASISIELLTTVNLSKGDINMTLKIQFTQSNQFLGKGNAS